MLRWKLRLLLLLLLHHGLHLLRRHHLLLLLRDHLLVELLRMLHLWLHLWLLLHRHVHLLLHLHVLLLLHNHRLLLLLLHRHWLLLHLRLLLWLHWLRGKLRLLLPHLSLPHLRRRRRLRHLSRRGRSPARRPWGLRSDRPVRRRTRNAPAGAGRPPLLPLDDTGLRTHGVQLAGVAGTVSCVLRRASRMALGPHHRGSLPDHLLWRAWGHLLAGESCWVRRPLLHGHLPWRPRVVHPRAHFFPRHRTRRSDKAPGGRRPHVRLGRPVPRGALGRDVGRVLPGGAAQVGRHCVHRPLLLHPAWTEGILLL